MSSITAVRPTDMDHVFFVTVEGKEMLATASNVEDAGSLEYNGISYRLWSPSTSKLASMITKGMKIPLHNDSRVLYLGAASGTTVSHVSDIVTDGIVYAVEFAPRPANRPDRCHYGPRECDPYHRGRKTAFGLPAFHRSRGLHIPGRGTARSITDSDRQRG